MQNKRRTRPWALSIIAIAIIGIAAVLYFKPRDIVPASSKYTVAKVERGALTQAIATTGTLSPLISVEVSSQISGLITDVEVDFNSPVRKGQILARIDPSTYEQKLQQAQANLAAAQAAHALNTINAARLKGLREADLVSQQDYDQAKATLEQSQANQLTQEATVKNAQTDLDRCTITSPIDGIVIYKQADIGKTVVSSFSAPTLFTIAQDLAKMRILAPISEVDIWSVKPGQQVSFTVDALPGRTFHGKLTQIRNPYTPSDKPQQSQQQQATITSFDSVIEVDNRDLLLRPSLTAIVSVIVAERPKVLKIPAGALNLNLTEGPNRPPAQSPATNTATVYRLPNGNRDATPKPTSVQVGITDGFMTEIVSGVNEGDTIVTGTASTWETEKRSLFRQ